MAFNTSFIFFLRYGLAFCQIVTGIVFAFSFVSKVRNIPAFIETINRFRLLPSDFTTIAAFVFLSSELAVVIAMVIGSSWLAWGFVLAAILLTIFCFAMGAVLQRKIQTSCNCFGVSEKLVSSADIVRNIGFIVCSLGGLAALVFSGEAVGLSVLGWAMTAFVAAIFVVIWFQLGEIIQLFR